MLPAVPPHIDSAARIGRILAFLLPRLNENLVLMFASPAGNPSKVTHKITFQDNEDVENCRSARGVQTKSFKFKTKTVAALSSGRALHKGAIHYTLNNHSHATEERPALRAEQSDASSGEATRQHRCSEKPARPRLKSGDLMITPAF